MFSFTLTLILVTAIVSFGAFSSARIMNDLIFYPPAIRVHKQYYRFFSSGFIHADLIHLGFNMFTLYMFGGLVESWFLGIFGAAGKGVYLGMYLLALPVSILPTYLKNRHNTGYQSLGASGAVSAVIFAALMIAPDIRVGLFLIPPVIPGFVFGPAFLLISAWLDRKGGGNINHSAHLWGALFGVAFLILTGALSGRYDAVELFLEGVRHYLRN